MHVPPHAAIWATVFMGRRKEQDKQESQYREKKKKPSLLLLAWDWTSVNGDVGWGKVQADYTPKTSTEWRRSDSFSQNQLGTYWKAQTWEYYTNKIAKMYYKMITTVLLPLSVVFFFFGIVINQILFAPYINEHILLEKIPISVVWFRLFGFGRRRGSDKWLANAVLTIS